MANKYRIAMGLDLTKWDNLYIDHLKNDVMLKKEAESLTITRATAIFYSEDPFGFISSLEEDGNILASYFHWINISKE